MKDRKKLYKLLGDLPDRSRQVSCKKIDESEYDGYILEKLMLDLNGEDPVPAYFAKPKDTKGKMPVVLYNHAHGGNYKLGKDEFIEGRGSLKNPPYAKVLTDMGYCGLCIDHWVFGERRGCSEGEMFRQMLWNGQVLWGMMVYDSIKALDYLCSRDDTDENRIATVGLSMGSTMAWWLAALDERVKVCIDLCCLTDFHTLVETGNLSGHGVYYFVPSLLKHFSTSDINSMIAPRPHLSLAGIYDDLTPVKGLDIIDKNTKKLYAKLNAENKWKLVKYNTGHFENADMRKRIKEFLAKYL